MPKCGKYLSVTNQFSRFAYDLKALIKILKGIHADL